MSALTIRAREYPPREPAKTYQMAGWRMDGDRLLRNKRVGPGLGKD